MKNDLLNIMVVEKKKMSAEWVSFLDFFFLDLPRTPLLYRFLFHPIRLLPAFLGIGSLVFF